MSRISSLAKSTRFSSHTDSKFSMIHHFPMQWAYHPNWMLDIVLLFDARIFQSKVIVPWFYLGYSTNEYRVYYSVLTRSSSIIENIRSFEEEVSRDFTLQIRLESMNISMARIFPSNFISPKDVKSKERSQSILISSLLREKEIMPVLERTGERGFYLTSSPFSLRFRAFDNRFRRRVRTSSMVEIRKNSPKDSTPYRNGKPWLTILIISLTWHDNTRLPLSTLRCDTRCLLFRTIEPSDWT